MDRREFLRITGGAAILGTGIAAMGWRPMRAQGTAPLAGLGLPEVRVTLTEAGFQVSPSQTPAGWALVTFENGLPEGNYNTADLMRLPVDKSTADVQAVVTDETGQPLPDWVFDIVSAGGPGSAGGGSAQAVVLLTEGNWIVGSAAEPYAPATLSVTAGSAATPEPPSLAAAVEVSFQEFAFVGLDAIAVGPHVWKIENIGAQTHVMVVFAVPEGMSTEQLTGGFVGMMTGTPVPDAVDLATLRPVGGCGDLSAGLTAWHLIDLATGDYGAVCFVPDEVAGAPHVMLGMATVFSVA